MIKSTVSISNLIILLVVLNTSNGDVCINDVIKCYKIANNILCAIYQNNIDTISQAISFCSAVSFTELYLYIAPELGYTTTIITINVAANIQRIFISCFYCQSKPYPVYLASTRTHPNVLSIELEHLYIYNFKNFFYNFPNIEGIRFYRNSLKAIPEFSMFKKLTSIVCIRLKLPNSKMTMDKKWVGGLSNLRLLALNRCGIEIITADAFSNLESLTRISLSDNNILELKPGVFRDLTALKSLIIQNYNSKIKIHKDAFNQNAFSPLKKLTRLNLSYSTIIPFDAFTTISSIRELYLPRSSTGIVPITPFQHLHNLTYLSFYGIPLVCNCSMQWASIIGKFGISVDGWCKENSYVADSTLYTECGVTESYQCFNKTVACKNTCINTPDSYICACDVGYGLSLIEAKSACHDIDECLANTSHCEQKCHNTLGSYQCYCDSGYKLSDDLISCTDIDECSKPSWNTCKHQCLNELGSYRCTCNPGYQLAGDGYSCYDLDECSNTSLNTCDQHTCINVLGNLYCCRQGYQLTTNGKNCEDINECSLAETNSCGYHQCLNVPGSYKCVCNEGYELAINNISCHDTDECMDAKNSCNQHKCLNLVGSYTCSCGDGYQLSSNGKSCEDIDECNLVTLNSCGSHLCMNEPGSYRCVCDEGFHLAVNNISCHDTDECMDANNSCNPHTCRNLVGSYTCSCGDGYHLTSDGKSCEIKPSI